MYDPPAYVWALTLAGAAGIPAATVAVLHRAAAWHGGSGRGLAAAAAGALAGWLGLSAVLAGRGVYDQPGGPVPWLAVAVTTALGGMLAATGIPAVSRALAAPRTLAELTLPHAVRVAGIVFVLVMAQGHLPAAFALPAGLGDVAIGLAAPFVARRLAADPLVARPAAVRFHVLGILDLVVAGTLGLLLFGIVDATPSTAALRVLPLALILTVPVPLAVALHVTSLRQLRRLARAPLPTTIGVA